MSFYGQFPDALNMNFTTMISLEIIYRINPEVIKHTFASEPFPLTLLVIWK
jgi:hypothetical protein